MRKIKSTALLGAFVAIAGVTTVSHEAGATTISVSTPNVAKETVPGIVSVGPVDINPSVSIGTSNTITFTLNGADFVSGSVYYINNNSTSGQVCSATGNSSPSITFTNCSLSPSNNYALSSISSAATSFYISVPQSSSSIIISYNSSVSGDTSSSATLADIIPQFSAQVSNSIYAISVSSLTSFSNLPNIIANSAFNYITMNNNEYGVVYGPNKAMANITFSQVVEPNSVIDFLFTGVPNSVTSVNGYDDLGHDSFTSSAIPGNNSATIGVTLSANGLLSNFQDYYTFVFSNSGNITPGNILVTAYSVPDTGNIQQSITYLSNQPFMTWTLSAVQIYVPDALVPYNDNAIEAGYITISMPSSASIASVQILNSGTSVSCSTSGLLTSTGFASQSYIDLSRLPSLCTGVPASAWQSGLPLVIYVSGPTATPSNVVVDGYAVIKGYGLKRLPANVLYTTFPYFSAFNY